MIKSFLDIFTPPQTPTDLPFPEAFAALLVRLARADGDYAQSEIARIDQLLTLRFGYDATKVQALREAAETLEKDVGDTVRLTKPIKAAVAYEDRIDVVEALWSLSLADGARDYNEDGLMRLIVSLLGVNDRDSAFARQAAAKAMP